MTVFCDIGQSQNWHSSLQGMSRTIFHYTFVMLNVSNCDPEYMTSEIIMQSFSVTCANIAVTDI